MLQKIIAAICTLAVFLTLITYASAAPLATPTAFEVIAAVNALRASHGLPPYLVDPILMMAAQGQADYLASTPNFGNGHVGPGGTDADARAHALGYPEVPGLDINENWGTLREGDPIETLIFGGWNDNEHMHTMLHERGQHVGAGVSVSGERVYVVLDVAAYWGDAGLTSQPTTSAFGGTTAESYNVSQYIAPVSKATAAPDGSITHVVMSGQSLWMIAHHYEVEIEQIRQLNYLGVDDMIYIGQKVIVQPSSPTTAPVIATATSPATPTSKATANDEYSKENIPTKTTGSPTPQSIKKDESGWFLAFFGLFGIGVLLVVLSVSTKR
ncbi:MAG: LysM peptidoglycan-binding domain-containing protein [Chloroflexi bacterium]|nr:LysM peptidoglycan-binding domain-containing protein [Chloroflexota bacterium]